MNPDPLELAKHIREMSDKELLALCNSGALNEIARPIAIEELALRGLPLPEPAGAPEEAGEYQGDFVTVAQYLNPINAEIVRSCLEASGVPAMVADANLVQMNSLWTVAVGGVRIRVPASRVIDAREVLAAYNRGDFALPDD